MFSNKPFKPITKIYYPFPSRHLKVTLHHVFKLQQATGGTFYINTEKLVKETFKANPMTSTIFILEYDIPPKHQQKITEAYHTFQFSNDKDCFAASTILPRQDIINFNFYSGYWLYERNTQTNAITSRFLPCFQELKKAYLAEPQLGFNTHLDSSIAKIFYGMFNSHDLSQLSMVNKNWHRLIKKEYTRMDPVTRLEAAKYNKLFKLYHSPQGFLIRASFANHLLKDFENKQSLELDSTLYDDFPFLADWISTNEFRISLSLYLWSTDGINFYPLREKMGLEAYPDKTIVPFYSDENRHKNQPICKIAFYHDKAVLLEPIIGKFEEEPSYLMIEDEAFEANSEIIHNEYSEKLGSFHITITNKLTTKKMPEQSSFLEQHEFKRCSSQATELMLSLLMNNRINVILPTEEPFIPHSMFKINEIDFVILGEDQGKQQIIIKRDDKITKHNISMIPAGSNNSEFPLMRYQIESSKNYASIDIATDKNGRCEYVMKLQKDPSIPLTRISLEELSPAPLPTPLGMIKPFSHRHS